MPCVAIRHLLCTLCMMWQPATNHSQSNFAASQPSDAILRKRRVTVYLVKITAQRRRRGLGERTRLWSSILRSRKRSLIFRPHRMHRADAVHCYTCRAFCGPGAGDTGEPCKTDEPTEMLRQITTPTPHQSIFTGRMLFLTPNQQCQTTEGNNINIMSVDCLTGASTPALLALPSNTLTGARLASLSTGSDVTRPNDVIDNSNHGNHTGRARTPANDDRA